MVLTYFRLLKRLFTERNNWCSMMYMRYRLPNGEWTDALFVKEEGEWSPETIASHIEGLEVSYDVSGIEPVFSPDADPSDDPLSIPPSVSADSKPKDKHRKTIEAIKAAHSVKELKTAMLEYFE